MIAHCMFEQSGTFKNEFRKLGIEAYDYDILNDFNETEYCLDLFDQINKAYINEPSVFDNISTDDLIIAFFPCTSFNCTKPLHFRGQTPQQKNWTDEKKYNTVSNYIMNYTKPIP